jgi:hypothetical protein
MSVRLNLEAFGTYKTTTNERKGTLYSTDSHIEQISSIPEEAERECLNRVLTSVPF